MWKSGGGCEKRSAKKQIVHTTSYSRRFVFLPRFFPIVHFCFALLTVRWNGLKRNVVYFFPCLWCSYVRELYSTPLISFSYLLSMHVNILCHKIPIHIKWILTLCRCSCMCTYKYMAHSHYTAYAHRKSAPSSTVSNGWNERARTRTPLLHLYRLTFCRWFVRLYSCYIRIPKSGFVLFLAAFFLLAFRF